MKRILALVLVVAMICAIALTVASCGATVECSVCGEKYNENQGETMEILGEKVYMCPDCVEAAQGLLG